MAAISGDERTCTVSTGPQDRRGTCLLTDHDVNEVLGRKFRGGNFRLLDWRLEPLGETKGLLGRYYQLRVTARRDGRVENVRFFAKTPSDGGLAEYLRQSDAFNKEIAFYKELISRMDPIGRSEWTVECYLCKQDTIIVLEDASINGYVTMDKYTPLDEQHCALLLRTLARLHSRSLLLDERLHRESGQTLYDLYGHLLKEVLYVDRADRSEKVVSCATAIYAVVDLVEELDGHGKDVVRRRIGAWIRKIPRFLAASRERRNVVCHRDVWANNLMFRHDHGGVPRGCRLIDFQFFCYCPPEIDFACCLYLTTDRATRDRGFDLFVRVYYESFARNLAEEGVDVEECLPWSEFRESCVAARNMALVYACVSLPTVLLPDETMMDYFHLATDKLEGVTLGDQRADLVRHYCGNVPAYRARLLEIILEIKDRLPEHPADF